MQPSINQCDDLNENLPTGSVYEYFSLLLVALFGGPDGGHPSPDAGLQAFRVYSLLLLPVRSLSFVMLVVEDVSSVSSPRGPAAMPHPSTSANMESPSKQTAL